MHRDMHTLLDHFYLTIRATIHYLSMTLFSNAHSNSQALWYPSMDQAIKAGRGGAIGSRSHG